MSRHAHEGKTTVAVEKRTSKIPSIIFLTAGLGALTAAGCLMFHGKKNAAMTVGQWAAPLLIMGLYNKVVKTQGHD